MCSKTNTHKLSEQNLYSDKLAHIQAVINCQYSVAQMCTCEDTLAHNLGALYIDDVMSYNLLTTHVRDWLKDTFTAYSQLLPVLV